MATETCDARFTDLDRWPTEDVVAAIWDGQRAAVAAIAPALPAITGAIDDAAIAIGDTGRIIYAGAGTSGRIGVQDGAELTPTFDWPRSRVAFVVAGGMAALVASVEGAEDDAAAGDRAMAALAVGASDIVIGVAASGTTPFTVAALKHANRAAAVTIALSSNAGSPLLAVAKHPINIDTGPEIIAGSTRMRAGTAQKIVLNMISTGIMIRLGRVFHGMMVEMQASNAKLRRRATAIVMRAADCSAPVAEAAIEQAHGHIKLAILISRGLDVSEAQDRLALYRGNLRAALAGSSRQP